MKTGHRRFLLENVLGENREAHVDDDAGSEPREPPMLFDAQPGPRAQLAAIVEVLSVLARSASSQEEVFDAVVDNARRLCGADVAQIHLLTDGALSSPTRWA